MSANKYRSFYLRGGNRVKCVIENFQKLSITTVHSKVPAGKCLWESYQADLLLLGRYREAYVGIPIRNIKIRTTRQTNLAFKNDLVQAPDETIFCFHG